MMQELKGRRESYGGDERAINKHSVRVYEHNGREYHLNRCLSGCPPFFELYYYPEAPRDPYSVVFSRRIKVDGHEYWGSGLSWPKAERIARAAILNQGKDPQP